MSRISPNSLIGVGIVPVKAEALTQREQLSVTDEDSQNVTLTAAEILGGITVQTSVTGAGTATTDTAENIIDGCSLKRNGDTIQSYYVNDGSQVVTFAGGTDVTVADAGQTLAANESAILLFRRATASTVTLYIFGA